MSFRSQARMSLMMKRSRFPVTGLALLVGIGAAIGPAPLLAHPHVWVTARTEVQVGPNKEITGFRHTWTFDEFYASFAVQGLDKDGDGKYSREELKPLADVNVQSLKEFDFFTHAKVSENGLASKEPVDYWLEYKDSLLTLHFTLPLEKPVPSGQMGSFSFSIYDPAFYVAFSFADEAPVKLASSAPLPCQPKVGKRDSERAEVTLGETLGEAFDPSADIGEQYAQTVTLTCKSS